MFILFFFLIYTVNVNSIYAYVIPLICAGIVVTYYRKDLFFTEVFNGLLVVIVTVIMFMLLQIIFPNIFDEIWMIENLTGHLFLGIPIEEILFAFCLGFSAGGVYELILGKCQ